MAGHPLPPEAIAEIKRLRKAGVSIDETAYRAGVSKGSVQKYAKTIAKGAKQSKKKR